MSKCVLIKINQEQNKAYHKKFKRLFSEKCSNDLKQKPELLNLGVLFIIPHERIRAVAGVRFEASIQRYT